jgi:hypothetical protein
VSKEGDVLKLRPTLCSQLQCFNYFSFSFFLCSEFQCFNIIKVIFISNIWIFFSKEKDMSGYINNNGLIFII